MKFDTRESLRLLLLTLFQYGKSKPVWACITDAGEVPYWSVGQCGARRYSLKYGPFKLVRITAR